MADADRLALMERLAIDAGAAILAVRKKGFDTEHKSDASPVTEADRAAETIILDGLRAAMPGMPIVAEEAMAAGGQPDIEGGPFILVDPLDGTKEFVRGGHDYTVNIAIIEDGQPIAGVVYAPSLSTLWSGDASGASVAKVENGAVVDRHPMRCAEPHEPLRIVASKSHRTDETDAFLARYGDAAIVSIGSSLKFCLLAENRADLYPRFGRTMEWDTAAGHAVLRAAGGLCLDASGAPLAYGKTDQADDSDFANGWFIAAGRSDLIPEDWSGRGRG